MRITNKYNLPDVIVNAIKNDPYTSGDCDISVTRLISPPRKVALEALHFKELEEDASQRIWSLFGQAMHVVLERAETVADTEQRLSIERCGWTISGQFDNFDAIKGTLTDYKVTSVYSAKSKAHTDYEAQLNLLAHILRCNGYTVNSIQIVAILRDFSPCKLQRETNYPTTPVQTIIFPLWSEEKCENYIFERIRLHQEARTRLPRCNDEECWKTPDTYALMKENRKTAVKLFEDRNEAATAYNTACDKAKDGEIYYIQKRPGRCVRCEDYCPAKKFCTQYQEYKAQLEKAQAIEQQ